MSVIVNFQREFELLLTPVEDTYKLKDTKLYVYGLNLFTQLLNCHDDQVEALLDELLDLENEEEKYLHAITAVIVATAAMKIGQFDVAIDVCILFGGITFKTSFFNMYFQLAISALESKLGSVLV